MRRKGLTCFMIIVAILAFGYGAVNMTADLITEIKIAKFSSKVTGYVKGVYKRTETSSSGSSKRLKRKSHKKTTMTVYDTTVSYSVDGKEYIGTKTLSSVHYVGSDITVYYDPDSPEEFLLYEPDSGTIAKRVFFVVIIYAAVAFLIFIFVMTVKHKKCRVNNILPN